MLNPVDYIYESTKLELSGLSSWIELTFPDRVDAEIISKIMMQIPEQIFCSNLVPTSSFDPLMEQNYKSKGMILKTYRINLRT